MEVVVGATPDRAGDDAVALGAATARTFDLVPVLTHIYPRVYDYPSAGAVDAEWRAFLQEQARDVVDAAAVAMRERGIAEVRTHVHGHRSSGVGLGEVALDRGAGLIVIGSAPGGTLGRLVSGSTADQLFHGSPVPVLMAPHGFAASAPERLGRFVVAHQLTRESTTAVHEGLRVAREAGLAVHLVSVISRVNRIAASTVGRDPEALVVAQMRERAEQTLAQAAASGPVGTTWEVVTGASVEGALAAVGFREGDVLVIGSSGAGPLRRVFLGDMSFKLLRAATVPAMVIPRAE